MEWGLATTAGIVLLVVAFSRRLSGTPVTPAMAFTAAGLIVGPAVLGIIDIEPTGTEGRTLAEATLTLVLFSDASRLDLRAMRREFAVPARLLGIGLPLTIVAGALVADGVFGSLGLAEAAVLAIVLAPTDAALGQAVVTDERIPSRVRQGLNVESGLNDGICVPLLLIAIVLAQEHAGALSGSDALRIVFEEIGYGILGGIAAGAVTAVIVRVCGRRGLISGPWLQVAPVAGAALAYGLAVPLDGSGFIAAFVGGVAFRALLQHDPADISFFNEEFAGLLSGVTFIVFGAVLLGPNLDEITAEILLYSVLSLTVIRIAPVAVAMLGTGARPPTVAFLGWFGPRGLASIVFAALVVEEANLPGVQGPLVAVYVTVGLSVLLHGLTAVPLADRYARWYAAHPRDRRPPMEAMPVDPQRPQGPVVSEQQQAGSDT